MMESNSDPDNPSFLMTYSLSTRIDSAVAGGTAKDSSASSRVICPEQISAERYDFLKSYPNFVGKKSA
jgi:hypothetical protein